MPFVTTREMLKKAQREKYAIGAFNVENIEMIQAVLAAAEKRKSPVIIQTTSGTLQYIPPKAFAALVARLAKDASVPVALHLDHGSSFDLAQECIQEGYSSVMIDGSLLPFEDNIALSRRVVEMAGDIPVEAELGTVGGKEDSHSAAIAYTDPLQAAEFVKRSGISSFAPAIGTAHGIYKIVPKLDFERLEKIASLVEVPLVLHGTSGVPAADVQKAVSLGICKINYATDLRGAFSQAVQQYMAQEPHPLDPKKYLSKARDAVQERVENLMELCGSIGKA